ncbi:MAG: PIN/TRAM domain-containing protein [Anaerovoracaceae bacterium]|jgi:uncharacterized protein YacL
MVEIGIAIIFGIIFFKIEPALVHQSKRLSDRINQDMQDVSSSMLVSGTLGLIAGLIVAYLVSRMFFIITNRYIYGVVVVLTYGFFCYLGVLIGTSKRNELPNIRQPKQTGKPDAAAVGRVSGRKKGAQQPVPKILDTSVIIDGRIAEILKTGFLEGPIIIPDYVLVELRHIADSSDSLKRVRGRRGLDILKMIQDDYGVEIYNTENEKLLKEIPEVDVKLLKLAQIMNGKVVTNDYNLNKVAGINGVGVLNINELANCLKPVVLPGEEMTVDLVKQGKDPGQGVGYLDDGTMIVVENGRRMIGKTAKIKVTSVFQTSAGRMIFGRLK